MAGIAATGAALTSEDPVEHPPQRPPSIAPPPSNPTCSPSTTPLPRNPTCSPCTCISLANIKGPYTWISLANIRGRSLGASNRMLMPRRGAWYDDPTDCTRWKIGGGRAGCV